VGLCQKAGSPFEIDRVPERDCRDNQVPIELDVASQESADSAIEKIVAQCGRLAVVVHNAGHIVFGPAPMSKPAWRYLRPATANLVG
jgi:NAD(P)-dependent dehydrogenase (short-subunit alcohol dehydrogenase family)